MSSASITDWYRQATHGDTDNVVAKRIGVNQSTIWRQRQNGSFATDNLIAIARAYDRNPLEPLLIAGIVTRYDIEAMAHGTGIHDATDDELIGEVSRRLAAVHDADTPSDAPTEGIIRVRDENGDTYDIPQYGLAAKHGDAERESMEFEEEP